MELAFLLEKSTSLLQGLLFVREAVCRRSWLPSWHCRLDLLENPYARQERPRNVEASFPFPPLLRGGGIPRAVKIAEPLAMSGIVKMRPDVVIHAAKPFPEDGTPRELVGEQEGA